MTITLTHQVQSLRDKLTKYVQACVDKQQVNGEAAQYFLTELRAMPAMPRYTLTGLSQVGKTTITEVLVGQVAANCISGTYFIHESVHMLYPANTFLHDIDSLAPCILQIAEPYAVDAQSDTILWVTQYGNIGSAEEVEILAAYHAAGKRIIGIVNMIDIHDQLVDAPLMEHLEQQLKPLESFIDTIFPISASYAKTAKEFNDDALYERSGFVQLEAFLEDSDAFYVEQMKQCWALFEPFCEYVEAIMKTAYKDIEALIKQFELHVQQVVTAQDEVLQEIMARPLLTYVPAYEGKIEPYMQHDVFYTSSLKELVLETEMLFHTPATIQELEDLMAKLLDVDEVLPERHIYDRLEQLYNDFTAQTAAFALAQKQHDLQQWQQAQTLTFLQHEDITAYNELYTFHRTFMDKLSQLFEQPLPITLHEVNLNISEQLPKPLMTNTTDFVLPFTFEELLGAYITEQMKGFFDETEQHVEATESVIREMTQIVDSALRDEEAMEQFHERLTQAETINELLLMFDSEFNDDVNMNERFELFHELIENYRMMEAKMDIYDEQALQTLQQHEETYKAIVAPYRHLTLLTNQDKRELRSIAQDYRGIQAFREQQYEELARAYSDLEQQANEHKQMLIEQYDQYMKRYKEQMQQREFVMAEWQEALEERQEMLVKRDRLRILQNSKLVVAHTEQPALASIEQRIDLLLLRIEQLYDYDLAQLPAYNASMYTIAPIKEAALPVEWESHTFNDIETIPSKYDVMPYRGLMISGFSIATVLILFGIVYAVLFTLGMVETPITDVFAQRL